MFSDPGPVHVASFAAAGLRVKAVVSTRPEAVVMGDELVRDFSSAYVREIARAGAGAPGAGLFLRWFHHSREPRPGLLLGFGVAPRGELRARERLYRATVPAAQQAAACKHPDPRFAGEVWLHYAVARDDGSWLCRADGTGAGWCAGLQPASVAVDPTLHAAMTENAECALSVRPSSARVVGLVCEYEAHRWTVWAYVRVPRGTKAPAGMVWVGSERHHEYFGTHPLAAQILTACLESAGADT